MVRCAISAFIIFLSIIKRTSTATTCEIDGSSCTYTVTCKLHPGSASNPSCSGEPNVTFVITSSNAMIVTTGFFGNTNFDSRVRTIKAVNNTWIALGGYAFRYYSKLRYMDLSANSITDVQDETFKSLASLKFLNLSHNLITDLNPKSFLILESKSTNLDTLDLSYNRIRSISDEMLSYLPSLITIYLQGNRLITIADNCFGSLKYLTTLELQDNLLESLNMSLINLKNLKHLDLSHNVLKKISGYETNRLQALDSLNISNNNIETIESNCFVQSSYLKVIDLSFNFIKMPIDNVMFAGNINLEYLDLHSNNITGIEGNSFKHNRLTFLNLESNNITGEIQFNTFTGLGDITKLDLSQQNIKLLRNNAFVDMKMLLHLNLSRNHISQIENSTFCNTSVSVVDLSHNNISELSFLKNALFNLTELYLNDNNITFVYKNTFQNQTLVKKLDLSGNKVIFIGVNSLPLLNLQYLNILNNRLTGVLRRNMMSPAKYLRFLDLSHFNITLVDDMTFVDMPVLARLNLSHNAIEQIMPDNFRGMGNLYSIDISYNKLADLQFNNSLLTNLKVAYLNNNKLTNISRIFPRTCNLLYLDMSHNGVSHLSNVSANLFPELQVLHLSNNNIENFNNPGTNTLTTLLDLGLSSNRITDIDLSHYKQLMVVDLSNNNLRVINNTFFKNIDFIQSMDLSRNNISDLPPGTFQNMRNLKLLNLSSNFISKLRYGSLKGLHKTELLDVSSNRIESLDVHVFHECTVLRTLIIDYNRIKTLDVERLVLVTQRSLKTVSLGGNPISCQEIIRNGSRKDLSSYGINQIEVTSLHKIYHEDNVQGIKCGDDDFTTTVEVEVVPTAVNEDSSSLLIIVWCSILTVILIIAITAVAYMKLRKRFGGDVFYRESTVHLGHSLE